MADPHVELRGGKEVFFCFGLLCWLFFLLQYFLPKLRKGPGPSVLSFRSAAGIFTCNCSVLSSLLYL